MTCGVVAHSSQGTSRAALDVLAGVTSEYLYNVGRTIRFLSDKFGGIMSAEVGFSLLLFGESRPQCCYRK